MPREITYTPFVESNYSPRYQFDYETAVIRDTKYSRDIEAKAKRGGPVYYRLVPADGSAAHHVLALHVFGEDAPILDLRSEFDPVDFNERYDFDFEAHTVTAVNGRPMSLVNRKGWKHYFLRDNTGRRVAVTHAEIRDFAKDRTEWEVPAPKGSRTVKGTFPDLAFTRDGNVWRVKSDRPLIRPERILLASQKDGLYVLTSASGRDHRITRASVQALFKSPAHLQ